VVQFVWKRRQICTKILLDTLTGGHQFEDTGVVKMIILKCVP